VSAQAIPQKRDLPMPGAVGLSFLLHVLVIAAITLIRISPPSDEVALGIAAYVAPQEGQNRESQSDGGATERPDTTVARQEVPMPAEREAKEVSRKRVIGTAETQTAASESDSTSQEEESATSPPVASHDDAVAAVTPPDPSGELQQSTPEPTIPAEPTFDVSPSQQARLAKWVSHSSALGDVTQLNDPELKWQEGDREYAAKIVREPAADSMSVDHVVVEVSTVDHGQRMEAQVKMKRLSFSSFTQLIDSWDTDVQLHDDVIEGRFHSNSRIFIGYDSQAAPKFLGKVTTAAHGFTVATSDGRHRREDIFRGGLETQTDRIDWPHRFRPVLGGESIDPTHVINVNGSARIVFYEDGTYGIANLGSRAHEERRPLPGEPAYIFGAPHETLYVRGTVNGKVLVYCPDRIVIDGSLKYASDPRTSSSDDYLGLVADGFIEIAHHTVTGRGVLEIDAAIFAGRRFEVTDLDTPLRSTLLIYGSLTAGTVSATEPRYATKIVYDSRFEERRPPGFPVTTRYEVE
jgi:hypothetical protein